MASTTAMPVPATRAKAVKPPFWLSSSTPVFRLLSSRLKKKSWVALSGLPPTLAAAIVPRRLEMPGSFRGEGRLTSEAKTSGSCTGW